jgi:hypothetical protein
MPARLGASIERRLEDGRVNRFSSRADFEAVLPGLRAESGFDAAAVGEAMFGWARTGQTGCLFATMLAAEPSDAGWQSVVIPEAVSDETLHALVHGLLTARLEAATVVFPTVDTPASLVALVNQVARLPDWHGLVIDGDEPAGLVRVGLRWHLPVPDHVSWVLGFGPFDFLPFTRRAPFTALVFRCGAEYTLPRRRVEDHDEVHLADLRAPVDEERYARMWSRTVTRKQSLLAGELAAGAKARVTFTLPADLRGQLAFAA